MRVRKYWIIFVKKINISIDDVSPHPLSSIVVLNQCFKLIKSFSSIKFTLFVPMAYCLHEESPCFVSNHSDFCKQLKELSPNSFEFGWHGYHHDQWNKTYNVKDREFRTVSYEDTNSIFKKMFLEAEKAGILNLFKPIFRPPAFKISCDALRFCKDRKISVASTYDSAPPIKPLCLLDKTEILYHACIWNKNYLDETKTKDLECFLKKHIGDIEFSFIDGVI